MNIFSFSVFVNVDDGGGSVTANLMWKRCTNAFWFLFTCFLPPFLMELNHVKSCEQTILPESRMPPRAFDTCTACSARWFVVGRDGTARKESVTRKWIFLFGYFKFNKLDCMNFPLGEKIETWRIEINIRTWGNCLTFPPLSNKPKSERKNIFRQLHAFPSRDCCT